MSSLMILASLLATAGDAPAPDYAGKVAPLLKKYCAGCHNDEDREGEFSLESYASLQKGTSHGPAFLPGDPKGSTIVRVLTGAARPKMPPKDEPRPGDEEVAVLESWIEAGARGPAGQGPDRLALIVPKVPGHSRTRPVLAMDATRDGRWLAVARDAEVGLYAPGAPRDGRPTRTLGPFPGKVTALHFTPDGNRLVTASGVAGLGGVAAIWDVATGQLERKFEGHRDILYDAELSPDGKTLATCSYDRKIELWDAATGAPLRTLEGHTGAVYDVAFSPDGRSLVSASADDTCKVWRVRDGLRLDTLPQPLKAESTCTFSPDGNAIVAGGADNNIRVWRFVSRDEPAINPMEVARFAHEAAIVRLAFTPDGSTLVSLAEDRTVKAWRASDYSELKLWDDQPDVATALAFAPSGKAFEVGRMDGSVAKYDLPAATSSGSADARAPSATAATPAGGSIAQVAEHEPNDEPAAANAISLPAKVSGAIHGAAGRPDADLFRFRARAGEAWVFEVDAARSKSRLDSFLEVLDAKGRRVPRVLLQAVRDSYFTFRGKDGSETDDFRVFNWEEMRLNEYLYASGEVVKLWLYPRGPDSGFVVYPGQGERWGYFDTTPLAHALGEPCYIVRPHPPGSRLVPNGLPVFSLDYENDDDAHRELGKDSRLTFTAPADGEYLVKVRDVRGLQGPEFRYTLAARPCRPDFAVTLAGADLAVGPGGAKEFKVSARRIDGFDGPIRVDIAGLPPGFRASTPLIIEAGQVEALGVLMADAKAAPPPADIAKKSTVRASAQIGGREVAHDANNLGTIKLAPAPKLRVTIGPAEGGPRPTSSSGEYPEYEIEPGQTITLTVKVERSGYDGQVPFGTTGAGRNLPFGVIVDNLGLNGLLVLENQKERTFFVTADRDTPDQVRPFHLTTTAEGGLSSSPVLLRVKGRRQQATEVSRR
ncbi:WD domain, G-beta repeat [Aquisphaera giovannonii]|uniref:WD domain, G-beta repeat n=1 Tax=Aquisphaera giovannonii TaxID=406548 RepID=A0A5B9W359_9BACT|nr:c-type cytochrome domain-containing protein [Aquisphaera giovannonii]QEH35028.1 WD domain, G-beta repeat [Aquisphaera giovannonii]